MGFIISSVSIIPRIGQNLNIVIKMPENGNTCQILLKGVYVLMRWFFSDVSILRFIAKL